MKGCDKIRFGIFFTVFLALIASGIAMKRVWHHPEFVVFFHLPAAVFLVLSGLELKKMRQEEYDREVTVVRGPR